MSIEKALADLTAALIANTAALTGAAKASTAKSKPADDEAEEKPAAKTGAKAGSKSKPKAEEAEEITKEVMQTALNEVKEKLGTDAAKAIVKKCGVAKMAEIEEDDYEKAYKLAKKALADASDDDGKGEDDGI